MSHALPLPYRWFIHKGLTNWEPWYFIDTKESIDSAPSAHANRFALEAFRQETGADFDVYLFARRQDMDTFAFFVARDGVVEDKVVAVHLSWSKRLETRAPLRYEDIRMSFLEWVHEVLVPDVADWMNEGDL